MNRKFIKNSNVVLSEILHSKDNLDILKDFIQTFLKIKINKISINESPIIKGKKTKEYGIVDVRVITKNNEELNIGIQIIDGDYIQNKMLLYYAKIHSNQLFYDDNRKIAKTVTINILDIPYFDSNSYHKIIKIKTNVLNDSILETIELHVLELSKCLKDKKEKISNEEAWIIYLRETAEEDLDIARKKNANIRKLDELLKKYWEKEII